ncbi:MAG: glycoside hydrolase family 130 protein [candidate division KSB1 bacterium]|nr:glycoside hydrolase family 130 protein [candidate division KSB1 bacterium]MDZ7304731.1 glycoside hydrolase family 130 protein [candidate division KSB1 bacterium]MDZ7313835.1 glycoside hydrolase family 130 protein [candidate division KSB1 bacterium]
MKRHPSNPIITREQIPNIPPDLVDVSSVFNPGAIRFGKEYLLLLRVQNRGRRTFTLVARSRTGVDFDISPTPVQMKGIENVRETIYHCYDPRITQIDGVYYVMFAMDMDSGCRLGLARTNDFAEFEFLGMVSENDNRNGVLFPEKIGGKYLRLDRPNQTRLQDGVMSGNTIVLSESNDLLEWKPVAAIASGRFHYWDELVGAGPPPIKTRRGWLQIYHGVATHFGSMSIYQAGVLLLDLENPAHVLARSRCNFLEPREMYELVGQVPNVVFPSGFIVEEYDAEGFARLDSPAKLYYGAADTCVALLEGYVEEWIQAAVTD